MGSAAPTSPSRGTSTPRELDRANRLAPDSTAIDTGYDRAFAETGQWTEVEAAAHRVLARQATNATAVYVRAVCLLEQRRLDEATAPLDRAVQAGVVLPELQRLRAEAFMVGNRIDDSEQGYRAAMASNPDDLCGLIGLGAILMNRNRPDDGAPLFPKAKSLKPINPRARAGVASVLE
jgi:cytochrome c-type biogenesis protein CcmH/NrfG